MGNVIIILEVLLASLGVHTHTRTHAHVVNFVLVLTIRDVFVS